MTYAIERRALKRRMLIKWVRCGTGPYAMSVKLHVWKMVER